jgi:hypothetical protein
LPRANGEGMERSVKVPEIMYQTFLALQNPRRFAVFDQLCKLNGKFNGKVATKDIELALQASSTDESIGYIADKLRELEDVKLAKYVGDEPRTQTREGDWKQTFKCYGATEHGTYIHELCRSYDSDRPLANLGGTLDPKRVVESFAKLKKEELAFMLDKFRDMYLLGAVLISIYYQKHESATSDWLSSCLDGRLSKDEVEKILGEYTGPDGLVVAQSAHRNIFERTVIRLAESIAGRSRVRKWISNASYSLRPEGKRIAVALSDEFRPSALGVNEQYLRPEKIEADDGVLGRAIVERFVFYGVFLAVTIYVWSDFFRRVRFNAFDSVGVFVDAIGILVSIFGWTIYMPDRLYALIVRVVYWRKLRRETKSKVS